MDPVALKPVCRHLRLVLEHAIEDRDALVAQGYEFVREQVEKEIDGLVIDLCRYVSSDTWKWLACLMERVSATECTVMVVWSKIFSNYIQANLWSQVIGMRSPFLNLV